MNPTFVAASVTDPEFPHTEFHNGALAKLDTNVRAAYLVCGAALSDGGFNHWRFFLSFDGMSSVSLDILKKRRCSVGTVCHTDPTSIH